MTVKCNHHRTNHWRIGATDGGNLRDNEVRCAGLQKQVLPPDIIPFDAKADISIATILAAQVIGPNI